MARHRTRHDVVVDQYARELRSVDELFPLDGGNEVTSLNAEAQDSAPARAVSTVEAPARSVPASRARAVA